jgi:hypothetical protein
VETYGSWTLFQRGREELKARAFPAQNGFHWQARNLHSVHTVDVDQYDGGVEKVSSPSLRITSEVVERALSDAEALIRSNGAVSGLDRLHTVFQAILRPYAKMRA